MAGGYMLRQKLKKWLLKKLGLKIYAVNYQTSFNELIQLTREQEVRFFKIKERHLKTKLAETLPITIITTEDPHNGHIKKTAYIYALGIE
jgi:hypothetical protein